MAPMLGGGRRHEGLDTPVLLGLLRGEGRVTSMLRKWESEELCTTSVNLFELESIARSDRAPPGAATRGPRAASSKTDRSPRRRTLGSARRSGGCKGRFGKRPCCELADHRFLARRGCSEWVTTREAGFPTVPDLKINVLRIINSKKS